MPKFVFSHHILLIITIINTWAFFITIMMYSTKFWVLPNVASAALSNVWFEIITIIMYKLQTTKPSSAKCTSVQHCLIKLHIWKNDLEKIPVCGFCLSEKTSNNYIWKKDLYGLSLCRFLAVFGTTPVPCVLTATSHSQLFPRWGG